MKTLAYIFFTILIFSCSELIVENEEAPIAIGELSPTTIETRYGAVDIHVNPDEFDHIYANFSLDLVIDGYMDWYSRESKEKLMDSIAVTVEIKGQGSAKYPLKSLGIIFKEEVSNTNGRLFDPPQVLERHNLDTLKAIRFRNSGNDLYGTMFKDLAYTQMVIEKNLHIDFMYGEPVHVFLNGQYYGFLNIRSESNEQGISRLFNKATEEITLMEVDDDNENLEHRAGDTELAQRLRDAITSGDTETLWEMLDVHNFIDYIIFEDYAGNNDWPGRNAKAFSINGGPFRFFLYDLDRAADIPRNPVLPELEYLDADIAKIYRALKKNPEFKPMLDHRQREIYNLMNKDLFYGIVERFAERIESDIMYNISKYNLPESKLHWRLNIEEIKRDYKVQDQHARGKYDL